MANVLDLRRRIRSVKSTRQITKAMKMIAAAKLNPFLWTNVYSIKVTLTFPNPLANQPGASTTPIQFTKVIGIMSRIGVDVTSTQ